MKRMALVAALVVVAGACGSVAGYKLDATMSGTDGSTGDGDGSAEPGVGGGDGDVEDETDGGSNDAMDGADGSDACARPASCAAIHTCSPSKPTGDYSVYPQAEVDAGVTVHCDMDTAGGGWTVIFLAASVAYRSTAIDYTVPSQGIRDAASEVMMSFRNLTNNMQASDYAVFALPATWRTKSPMTVTPYEELSVYAAVNGGLPALALLRYGTENFGALCSDPWSTTPGDLYGRICLQGTAAAFWSGFAVGLDPMDFCVLSYQSYNVAPCSESLRFSIAVR